MTLSRLDLDDAIRSLIGIAAAKMVTMSMLLDGGDDPHSIAADLMAVASNLRRGRRELLPEVESRKCRTTIVRGRRRQAPQSDPPAAQPGDAP